MCRSLTGRQPGNKQKYVNRKNTIVRYARLFDNQNSMTQAQSKKQTERDEQTD